MGKVTVSRFDDQADALLGGGGGQEKKTGSSCRESLKLRKIPIRHKDDAFKGSGERGVPAPGPSLCSHFEKVSSENEGLKI